MFKNKLTFKYIVIVTFAAAICTGVAKKFKTKDDAHATNKYPLSK